MALLIAIIVVMLKTDWEKIFIKYVEKGGKRRNSLLFAWASVVKVISIVETFLVSPIIKLHENNSHFLAVVFLVIR